MIDLDRPAQRPPAPDGPSAGGRRRLATARALALLVVGSLLSGAVLGGVAMDTWRYRPLAAEKERAESAVSVLLFADASPMTVHHDQRRVRIEAQVMVVNAGREPLNVLAVRVDRPDATVRSPVRERQIPRGTALPVDVVVEWDCVADQPTALAASVSVETVEEQLRTISPVALDGTPWIESGRGRCAGPG